MWPIIVPEVLTLEFHRGLPSEVVFIVGCGMRFPVGVADPCLGVGDGEVWLDEGP